MLGLDEEPVENHKSKFIEVIKENLDEEIKPEEIEIIHRIGRPEQIMVSTIAIKGQLDLPGQDRSLSNSYPTKPR